MNTICDNNNTALGDPFWTSWSIRTRLMLLVFISVLPAMGIIFKAGVDEQQHDVGGVAHDFNNMLSVILGHAAIARRQLSQDDPLHDSLLEIQNAASRSADLTRQLLAFARKQTIVPKVLDLNTEVTNLLKMLQSLIGKQIEIVWAADPHLWPVKIDPAQFGQILMNLAVNARDAIPGTGLITIATSNLFLHENPFQSRNDSTPGAFVLLTVTDTGAGMSQDTLSHIFEPFFTTKEPGKGTGLGLATVYGAVKQNNGIIAVKSEPGKGTTFKICLPRHSHRKH